MMRQLIFAFLCALGGCIGQADRERHSSPSPPPTKNRRAVATLANSKQIDLTHPFDEQAIYWPTEEGFVLERGPSGVTDKGYYYAANRFRAAEHGGTHVDAPIHFSAQGHTADQIELNRLIGEAAVIDVADKCASNRDYEITVADVRQWEEAQGRHLVDMIVLFRTGWSRHWPNREAYLGTSERGNEAVANLHFPGLSPAAARWLIENCAPKAVGIDTASIDYGQSTHFQSHVMLYTHNVPAFENVAELDQLPPQGAWIIALPMKIAGGSGSPLRIIALLPPQR
jgi:kynurenine formamidase